jgi:BTB/POZ domain
MDDCSQIHNSLYFSDGNIVLYAPSAPGRYTIFRVHQSILSKHSHVFENMFALPMPDGVNKMHDGVPLIYMPDAADEVESLLAVLYHDS